MMQLIHMTATYSNAMLVAILPHVSDCAKQLDLPIAQPITTSQVAHFGGSPYKNYIGGAIWLTNRYWFVFNNGFVQGFRSPDNWFTQQDIDNLGRFVGKDNMTTNEAIELARDSFRKLGYAPKDFHVDGPPTEIQGPYDNKKLGHIPVCEIAWNSPKATSQKEFDQSYNIKFDIDMQRKQVTGMTLMSKRFFQPDPKIDVEPELESDYRKRMRAAGVTNFASPWAGALFRQPSATNPPTQAHLFIRTNAPPHWPLNQGANAMPAIPLTNGQEAK